MDRLNTTVIKDELSILDGRHEGSYYIDLNGYNMDCISDIDINYKDGTIKNRKGMHHWTYDIDSKGLSIYLEHKDDIDYIKFVYYSIKNQRDIKINELLDDEN